MKFAFNTRILRFLPLSEAIDLVAKAGFDAVELMADRPHAFPEDLNAEKISALNQCLNERKLKVSNLNAGVVTSLDEPHNPSWLDEDWQKREQRVRYTLDCMRLAAAMGVSQVSTQGGGPIPPGTMRMASWRLFVANMHRVLPLARKLGVKLLIEPAPEMLIETSDHLLELLVELSFHECLGVSFDIVHLHCGGEDLLEAWEKLKAHVGLVRLSDAAGNRAHVHVQLGEGVLDLPTFLTAVRQSDYQGFVTIQPDGSEQRAEKIVYGAAGYLQEAGFMARQTDQCMLSSD
jgi:sugar phosphate isomerase/epimerase